jgi:hypothetical protein
MNSTYGTIILALIASMVCIILPTATIAHRQDIADNQVMQSTITKFGEEACETGVIKEEEYENLKANNYDIQITVGQIDYNPTKVSSSSVVDEVKIGENLYYMKYTYQVEEELAQNGQIELTQGNTILLTAEKTNTSMYYNLRKLLFGIIDQEKDKVEYYGTVLK